jgi:hypothetical protein
MSEMQWFRFHHEALDDPKVQKLEPALFKHWVNLLCIACRNDGKFPAHADMAFALRIDEIGLESVLDRLLIAGLIGVHKGGANGSYIAPNGWDKRQYKSDTSNERVKRYRQRYRNVTVTPPDTDTDTEVNTNVLTAKRRRVRASKPDGISDSLWRDWTNHRKTLFTDTALEGFEREAKKAGWSLDSVIREAIERGWQGFKADWVKDKSNGNQTKDGAMGTTERAARQAMHEISGGIGRFDGDGGQVSTGNTGGGNRTIDAVPNSVRAIGYAGG